MTPDPSPIADLPFAMRDRIDACIVARMPFLGHRGPHVTVARKLLNMALSYERTVALAESFRHKDWHGIMAEMSGLIARRVDVTGLHHVPAEGAALIVCNHPTGIADGIVLYSRLSKLRPDAYFFARGDVLNVFPQMRTHIAPVEWREELIGMGRMRGLMEFVRQAVGERRLGVIFPAGQTGGLAFRRRLEISELPWLSSAARIARRHRVPIIPLYIGARNSPLFYVFDALNRSLADIALFHETLNKGHQPYRLVFGQAIAPESLPDDNEQAIAHLREACLRLQKTDRNR